MSDPYVGEIRMVGFDFAPYSWALCNGQVLSMYQNMSLYTVIGTQYGGNGSSTFALPDLRGRAPIHMGTGSTGTSYYIGSKSGQETVTITSQQMPSHSHVPQANTGGNPVNDPSGKVWTGWTGAQYTSDAPNEVMNSAAVDSAGSGQLHENRPPYLVINFIIALQGIFPSRP